MRHAAVCSLVLLALVLAAGPWGIAHGYAEQDRDQILARPSGQHWLGTDSLGRDNTARFLYGGRLSVLLASLAALLACGIAALVGVAAAMGNAVVRASGAAVFDVMLSVPWYLLVFLVRAVLPLDAPPMVTAVITFGILGLVGWAQGARAVRDAVLQMNGSTWLRQARAAGFAGFGLLWRHVVPNVRPLLVTQFLLLLPTLLLGEATLGMLGLGIPEPLPSWGGSLVELVQAGTMSERPWTLVPAALLAMSSISLRIAAGPTAVRKNAQREVLAG